MIKRTKTFVLILLVLFPMMSFSQSDGRKNRMAVSVGIDTNYAYDFEFSYHYMLRSFFGIGVGLGFYNQWYSDYTPKGSWKNGTGRTWRIEDSEKEIQRNYLNPSIILQTPNLINKEKFKMSFFVEPGLQLLLPYAGVHVDYSDVRSSYVSTWGGEWCFWSFKAALDFRFSQTSIALGYGVSNVDIYSSRRKLMVGTTSFDDFYPEKDFTHSLFLNISYCFD